MRYERSSRKDGGFYVSDSEHAQNANEAGRDASPPPRRLAIVCLLVAPDDEDAEAAFYKAIYDAFVVGPDEADAAPADATTDPALDWRHEDYD